MNNVNATAIQALSISQQHSIPKIDPKADDKALREQTDAFESVIIKMLMDNSMKDLS